MIILAVETSCDETSLAVVRDGRDVLANEVFSQADKHALYGGVVPEIASRNHIAVIGQLAGLTLSRAGITKTDIDAVAVTAAPGLIGALLVGVSFAKGLAMALDVPLIPVHHIAGHVAANYIAYPELSPPFMCVIVSGGNSIIADVRSYTDLSIIGRSRDDAAGECFDKTARVLGLGYPGGPALDKLAQTGDDTKFKLPMPVIDDAPYDMSFSGLKTAVVNIVHNAEQKEASGSADDSLDKASLAASLCRAVSDILVSRVISAAISLGHKKVALAGGVAANSRIRKDFLDAAEKHRLELFIPPLNLCGDNAAMIGAQGFYEYKYAADKKYFNMPYSMTLDARATMDVSDNFFR